MPFFEKYFGCLHQCLICLFLKPLVPLGSCKTNSQNFADGSLPKREQKQFYLDLRQLVHQEKKKLRNKQRSETNLGLISLGNGAKYPINLDNPAALSMCLISTMCRITSFKILENSVFM